MKKIMYLNLAFLMLIVSCRKDDPIRPDANVTETLSLVISENTTLKADVKYLLKGKVYVKNNAVLSIPAGVTIEVEKFDNSADKSALVITKGSKLMINGTADQPVVFTSAAASKAPGDWVGIIVLGKAPTNLPNAHLMGFDQSNADNEFGSNTADDNSGSIRYLRLEYAGGLNPAQEDEWEVDMASGLSLMGVGSATVVDHVMVSNSRDDGFQFVGGNVNGKYLISYSNGDDDFDFDRGYTGRLQFLIGYKTALSNLVLRANGMESLNDKDASALLPYTRPIISNMTILGPTTISTDLSNLSQGIYIRKNTRFLVRNSIIAGYTNGGLMLCPKTKPLLVNNLGSQFKFNLINDDIPDRAFTYDTGGSGLNIIADPEVAKYAVETNPIQKESLNKNTVIAQIDQLQLRSLNTPSLNLAPQAQSAALSGADFSDQEYSPFFTQVTFRGAIGNDNWALGNWTNWK